jgi:hypothetical protein
MRRLKAITLSLMPRLVGLAVPVAVGRTVVDCVAGDDLQVSIDRRTCKCPRALIRGGRL